MPKREMRGRRSQLKNTEEVLRKLDALKPKIVELDRTRWKGEEWQRNDLPDTKTILFENSESLSPDQRLTAVWYVCILNRGVRYETVWKDGLKKVVAYLRGSSRMPQMRYDESLHFKATKRALGNRVDGFSRWLIKKTLQETSPAKGRLYRLVGAMADELLGLPGKKTEQLRRGEVDLLGSWKRLWMALMILRRDKSLFKELIEEAASVAPDGRRFLQLWYSDAYPENECELPVDIRILGFFRELDVDSSSLVRMAEIAHQWGVRNELSPSCIDVAFVPGMNEELHKYGLEKGLKWNKWWSKR